MNFISEEGFNEFQSALDRSRESDREPSFVDGSAGALFDGVANGFTQISSQAMAGGYDSTDGASALFGLIDSDPSAAYPQPETIRQNAQWAADTLRPDPATTGTMAQILFGVGDVGARFATGFAVGGVVGGALLSGTSVGEERYRELIKDGVDPETALGAAAIRGITTGAGALLPAGVGGSLATRIASGVGINTSVGIGGRAAESTALSDYKQGQEIKAFSAQDIAVDAILGGIFGGVSRLGIDVTHDQLDAAVTLKNAKSFNMDTMPGTPKSVGDIARHSKLMDTAIDDILNDRAVSVDAESGGVRFSPREMDAPELVESPRFDDGSVEFASNPEQMSYADIIRSAFDEEGYTSVYAEMTRAEEQAAQINRSQSQFTPEDVESVPEPSAFREIESESFRDLLPGDRVTASRDVGAMRAGQELEVRSVSPEGDVQLAARGSEPVTVSRAEAGQALDAGLSIRRPEPRDPAVPVEFGRTEPASELAASVDREVADATAEGNAYNAAVDCFLSRGN